MQHQARNPVLTSIGIATLAVAVIGAASVPLTAQAPSKAAAKTKTSAAKKWTTPWGDPDLQGVYIVATLTPLERPAQFGDRAFFTDQEAAALEKVGGYLENNADRRDEGDTGFYNRFWIDPGKAGSKVTSNRRNSLIVDPPDGRLPQLTPRGQQIKAKISELRQRDSHAIWDNPEAVSAARVLQDTPIGPLRLAREGSGYADSYLDRPPSERCVARALPKLGGPYNNGVEISQGPGSVVIHYEANDTRVIPLGGAPHVPQSIRQWLGDPRGRWEGTTLVVDTTNFLDEQGYQGGFPQGHLHLVERFTRAGDHLLDYTATFDDPATFTRQWTLSLPWVGVPTM